VTRIDARGMRCPWPALRLARTLRQQADAVEVLADDPIAERELAAVASGAGRAFTVLACDHFQVSAAA